jgi:Serine carboxypeptidase
LQIVACNEGLVDTVCSQTQSNCNAYVLAPLVGNWDPYYVPTLYPDPYPPNITGYLTSPTITAAIGAETTWTETSIKVYIDFADTGDWMKSSNRYLEKVIDAGVRTMLYDGDADYICNHLGVEAMVRSPFSVSCFFVVDRISCRYRV